MCQDFSTYHDVASIKFLGSLLGGSSKTAWANLIVNSQASRLRFDQKSLFDVLSLVLNTWHAYVFL